ncbi:MAG: hypothetical protein OEQ53_13925 [Saprospiraceae bacterium]|nr:hypothetical protein [Saprospiraceae bacterium]
MRVFDLNDNYDFRVFNGVIQPIIVFLAVRSYAKSLPTDWNYLSGVVVGVVTSLVSVPPFAIFQLLHLNMNVSFMEHLQTHVPYMGQYLNPFSAGLIIVVEGMAVGLVLSNIRMRIVDPRQKKVRG